MYPRCTRLFLALALAALCGCAQINTRTLPKVDLSVHKRIFVEHRLADSYGIAEEIARQLRVMGYDASSGALTMMPGDTELIVSYDDMWTWDFTTYMIEIDLQVRSAHSDKIIAVGHYFRPGMVFGRPPRRHDSRPAEQALQAPVTGHGAI